MTKSRSLRLRQLINERFNSKQIDFSKKTNISTAQIGQWLGGYRVMGEKSARKIEIACGLPKGWLDEASSAGSDKNRPVEIREAFATLALVFKESDDILLNQLKPIIEKLMNAPARSEELALKFEATLEMYRKFASKDQDSASIKRTPVSDLAND